MLSAVVGTVLLLLTVVFLIRLLLGNNREGTDEKTELALLHLFSIRSFAFRLRAISGALKFL